MSDAEKTKAELTAENVRLRQEAAALRQALQERRPGPEVLPGVGPGHRVLFEVIQEALFIARVSDGRVLYANPRLIELVGLPECEVLGSSAYDLAAPDRREHVRAMVAAATAGNRLIPSYELLYRRADGAAVPLRVGGCVIDSDGETVAVMYAQDLSETHQAQRRLDEAEERYRAVVESAADPIFMIDREGRFVTVNLAAATALGVTPEGAVGMTMHQSFPPPVAEQQWARVKSVFQSGRPLYSQENQSHTKEGPRWFNTSLVPVKDGRGEVRHVIGIARDVTDRKRAEEALRESEVRYRAIFDAANVFIVLHDAATGTILDANQSVCRAFGYTHAEICGRMMRDLSAGMSPYTGDEAARRVKRTADGETMDPFEWLCRDRSGRQFWVEVGLRRIVVGGQDRVLAIVHDIDQRKQVEEALRQSEADYRAIFDSANDFIVVHDLETGNIIDANESMCRAFGYTREEVRGLTMADISAGEPPYTHEVAAKNYALLMAGKLKMPFEWMSKDRRGRKFWVEVSLKRTVIGGKERALAVVRDISARKAAEEALRQSEENYRLLFEENILGIGVIVDNRIVKANEAFCAIHRLPHDEMMGRRVADLTHPDEVERVERHSQAVARGDSPPSGGNVRMCRGDGTSGWAEVRIGRMMWEGRPAVLVMVQDITEQMRLEADLREAQKMEAVGQLAGGIAHDFNNLMTGILCHANLLKMNSGAGREVHETAEVIEKAARRAADLTSQLLGFARRGKHQDIPVDLGATIQSVIRLLVGTLDPRVCVETRLPESPVWGRGDPAQMEQVILNLAMNARDSMPEGGRMTIAAETVDLSDGDGAGRPGAKPGRFVAVSVADTGCGIAESVRGRIFEPFFTTKPDGKGVGMGLAMVYGIVKNHGGWVEVDSEVDRGSAFRVYWPAAAAPARAKTRPPAPAVQGARRILLVDDDAMVRSVLGRMLEGMGYGVVPAANGREAVECYQRLGRQVDLAIIDVIMPEMGGRECLAALRRLDPKVKVILCTGGGGDGPGHAVADGEVAGFIRKPYQLEKLAAAIEKALAAP